MEYVIKGDKETIITNINPDDFANELRQKYIKGNWPKSMIYDGLKAAHNCRLITHKEYNDLCREFGVRCEFIYQVQSQITYLKGGKYDSYKI